MNQCGIQQNRVGRSRDDIRSATMVMPDHHRWDAVVRPKPRRGSHLFDSILPKIGHNNMRCNIFLNGSPPSRVSNPLIQDARFNDPIPIPTFGGAGSPSEPARKLGIFGNKPVVRVEGFDCLERESSRKCSISSIA